MTQSQNGPGCVSCICFLQQMSRAQAYRPVSVGRAPPRPQAAPGCSFRLVQGEWGIEGTGQENSECETVPGLGRWLDTAGARLLSAVSESLASRPPTWAQTPLGSPGDSGGEYSRKLRVHPFRLSTALRGRLLAKGSILMGPDWLLLPPWGSLSLGPVATLTHPWAPWLSWPRPACLS